VTRRELLALLGAFGCSGARAAPPRDRPNAAPPDARSDVPIVDDWASKYQLGPSRLIARGNVVARLTADELAFFDATTLARTASVANAYRSACAVGGALFAFTRTNGCSVDRFDGTSAAASMLVPGGCTSEDGYRLACAGPSTIYVSISSAVIARFAIANDKLEAAGRIRLDDPAKGVQQWLGLADGALLLPVRRTIRAYRGDSIDTMTAPDRIAHLCAGSPGRVWYSAWNERGQIDRVVLAQLGPTLSALATLALAHVVHVAAGADGGCAVFGATDVGWTIVVLDANGRERRRIAVASDLGSDLGSAFVAVTASSVLLDTGALHGWRLATGAKI
jgi:hypothetical protein